MEIQVLCGHLRVNISLGRCVSVSGALGEARDLALLLRAGALAAPMYIVEERTVGASLGDENIEAGQTSVTVGFILVMILFGKQVLLLYGPEYQDGYACLVMIAIGASVFTTFSMAPEFLKFSSYFTRVLSIQIVAGILIAGLTWWLASLYGANGAGLAYCISLIGMTLAFLLFTNRRLNEILESSDESLSDKSKSDKSKSDKSLSDKSDG